MRIQPAGADVQKVWTKTAQERQEVKKSGRDLRHAALIKFSAGRANVAFSDDIRRVG